MIKCPRCNLKQEESPQCEYCGLVFEEFRESTSASKRGRPKRTMLLAIVLVTAGALLSAYFLINDQDKPGGKSADVERPGGSAQRTGENELMKTAKELSGDVGILDNLAGNYSKGSIIAMVIFSIVGLGYMTYGKKSHQLLMLVCGIVLMGYSYFVNGTGYIILIGIGLSALPLILSRK